MPKIKRKLIATMIFDLHRWECAHDCPVVSWYYFFEGQKPIEISYSWKFENETFYFEFSDYLKGVIESEMSKYTAEYFKSIFPSYKGAMELSDYHKTPFGLELPFCQDAEHVKQYYQKEIITLK